MYQSLLTGDGRSQIKEHNLPKSEKADFRKEEREEEREFEPQATPRVFWLVVFFFFLQLSVERLEDEELQKFRFEFAERDESKLIVFSGDE